MAKYQDLGFLTFQIQVFLSFLIFLQVNILLSDHKNFEADSINREEGIL